MGPDGSLWGGEVAAGADVGTGTDVAAGTVAGAGASVGVTSFESVPHAARTRAIPRIKLIVEKMRRAGMSDLPWVMSHMPKTREAADLFHAAGGTAVRL